MLSGKCLISAYYFDESEKTREQQWLDSVKKQFETHRLNNTVICGIRFSPDVLKLLKVKEFDIYIIDGYSSLIQVQAIRWLVKNEKSVFVNVDGIDIWREETLLSKIKGMVKNGVYRSGAKFLCGSKIAANRIVELGADKDKVFVHPFTSLHESDIITYEEKIRKQAEYKKKIGAEGKKVVVAVGRFIPLKRYEVLIEAWKDMPDDCTLYLIGGGELRPEYEKQIVESSVKNMTILDYMDKEKLNEYYMAADLFVHTSETEVWGLVFNEAMAKGCPVITANHCVGGVELVRNGKEGYVTETGNAEELRQRMLQILGDLPLRESMMRQVLLTIRSYTYENLAATHLRIFNAAMDILNAEVRITKSRYFYSSIQKIQEFFGGFCRKGVLVLMFHHVYGENAGYDMSISIAKERFISFIRQMLDDGYRFICAEDMKEHIHEKAAVVTFDDAFGDIMENAVPFLEENGIPYTVFVCEGYLDRADYLTSDQLKRLTESPLCTIGYHTISHRMTRKISDERFRKEIDPSGLEKRIDRKINIFAYPFGSFYSCGFKKPKMTKGHYRYAFSTVSARCTERRISRFAYFLPRINVNDQNYKKLLRRM